MKEGPLILDGLNRATVNLCLIGFNSNNSLFSWTQYVSMTLISDALYHDRYKDPKSAHVMS
jgi:hypothetical protein